MVNMKGFYLLLLLFVQLMFLRGQNNDSIEGCMVKYKYLNIITNDTQPEPLTLFLKTNGNFYLRYGQINRPEKNEDIYRSFYDKKGKLIKRCHETYKKCDDSIISFYSFYLPIVF